MIERKYSICYSDEDGRDNDDNMRSDIFAASFLGHNFINDGLSKWTTTKYQATTPQHSWIFLQYYVLHVVVVVIVILEHPFHEICDRKNERKVDIIS